MKTIKIELQSVWVQPQTFETKDIKEAIEICEDAIDQQFLVFVNGEKYKPMRSFGKSVNLDDI